VFRDTTTNIWTQCDGVLVTPDVVLSGSCAVMAIPGDVLETQGHTIDSKFYVGSATNEQCTRSTRTPVPWWLTVRSPTSGSFISRPPCST
jgi:hypothetical protein